MRLKSNTANRDEEYLAASVLALVAEAVPASRFETAIAVAGELRRTVSAASIVGAEASAVAFSSVGVAMKAAAAEGLFIIDSAEMSYASSLTTV